MNWKLLTHQLDLFSHQMNVYGIQFAVCCIPARNLQMEKIYTPYHFLTGAREKTLCSLATN